MHGTQYGPSGGGRVRPWRTSGRGRLLVGSKWRTRRKPRRRNRHNPWQRTVATQIGHPFHRDDESVTDLGKGFYELGTFGGVFDRLPQLFHVGLSSPLQAHTYALRAARAATTLLSKPPSHTIHYP